MDQSSEEEQIKQFRAWYLAWTVAVLSFTWRHIMLRPPLSEQEQVEFDVIEITNLGCHHCREIRPVAEMVIVRHFPCLSIRRQRSVTQSWQATVFDPTNPKQANPHDFSSSSFRNKGCYGVTPWRAQLFSVAYLFRLGLEPGRLTGRDKMSCKGT
jgi:hypothetical protein